MSATVWTCARCLRAQQRSRTAKSAVVVCRTSNKYFSTTPPWLGKDVTQDGKGVEHDATEKGAMSRRLSSMMEDTMDTGSKSDRRTMQSASNNFSEELKARLEARIAESSFASDNKAAMTQANLPSHVGKGTEGIAIAPHWTGTESVEDAALRMLDDAHKKIRATPRPPRTPQTMNLRPESKNKLSQGVRLANARDKTSIYAFNQQEGMNEEEREKLRKELKERFTPGARPMPQTLQGLTSLANERIEDAIARGQFKNIKRGKNVNTERDYNANSPFLDTTEYFMNKIIQKQEIVPPWIEKQQEIAKMMDTFRKRLRSDWRRHAARMIASEGGTLEQQVIRAKGYALAEEMVNPRAVDKERVTGISSDGNLVKITMEDRIAAGVPNDKPEIDVQVVPDSSAPTSIQKIKEQENEVEKEIQAITTPSTPNPTPVTDPPAQPPPDETSPAPPSPPPPTPRILPTSHPFRDPQWQRAEEAYHNLAIAEINSLTRSYNLMAPKLAQRPYTNLERELKRCFAMVAPQVADQIMERATKKAVKGFGDKLARDGSSRTGGVFARVTGASDWKGHEGVIREEGQEKGYGFKEFWRDVFGNKEGKRAG